MTRRASPFPPAARPGPRWPRALLALFILLALVALPAPAPVAAATLLVTSGGDTSDPNDGDLTLREAIADANAGDTITFTPGITEVVLTGTLLLFGTDLTIDGDNPATATVETVTIRPSAGLGIQLMDIEAPITVELNHLALINGDSTYGGALYIDDVNAVVTMTDVTFSGGDGEYGAGIYLYQGSLALTNATFSGNHVDYDGAGLFVYYGTATLTNVTFSDNHARGDGGAVYVYGGSSSTTLINTTISGNYAEDYGGGVASEGGPITLINTTISGNTSEEYGGGVFVDGGSVTLINSTLSGNDAQNVNGGDGIFAGGGSVTLTSSIVAAPSGGSTCVGALTDGGYNLETGTTCNFSTATDTPPGTSLEGIDPLLGDLADHGGPTQTHLPGVGSPARDRIPADKCAEFLVTPDGPGLVDQRGVTRPQGTLCDIGAVEIDAAVVAVAPTTATYGDTTVTLSATVTRQDTGQPVPVGSTVSFTFQGATYLATTTAGGVATTTAPLAPNTAAGTYPGAVVATYDATFDSLAGTGGGPLVVDKRAQAITAFAPPTTATYGDAPLTLSATGGGSGLPVTFTAAPDTVCTVAASGTDQATLTLVGVGACLVTASQAGDANWLPADDVQRTITVGTRAQTITFPAPPAATYGDGPLTLTATATSGLPVSFTAGPAGVCAVSGAQGSTLTLLSPGACTVVAQQDGDATWSAAPAVSRVVGVAPCDGRFADVAASDAACVAIAALVDAGVIKGYDTNPPTFGPADDVRRYQVAAFLVRALGWEGRPTGPRTFRDLTDPTSELERAARILANACAVPAQTTTCVAQGYEDGRFGPHDQVTHAQVIAFIARAFALDPAHAWTTPAGGTLPYTGVPAAFQDEVATYHAHAGALPDAPTTAAGWDAPASRAWVARVLYQALQSAP